MIDREYENWRLQSASWTEIRPGASYKRALPSMFNFVPLSAEYSKWFLNEIAITDVIVPPQDRYSFKDVFISDLTLLYDKSGSPIQVSAIDHDQIPPLDSLLPLGESFIDDDVLFVFKAGKQNYGHLLVEMLPKLENISNDSYNSVLLVPTLGEALEKVFVELIHLVYPQFTRIKHVDAAITKCSSVTFVGPISKHNARKSAAVIAFADKVLNRLSLLPVLTKRKIYVSRRGASTRRLLNENDVEIIADRMGFEIIYPEMLSLRDQIRYFSEASVIVGPMGAGLTNIMFSPPGASVCVIDPGYADLFFYDLAAIRRLKYSWIFAKGLNPCTIESLHGPWSIDLQLFRLGLEAMLSNTGTIASATPTASRSSSAFVDSATTRLAASPSSMSSDPGSRTPANRSTRRSPRSRV